MSTEVTEIVDPSALQTDAFNSVFIDTFDSLTFQFGDNIDLEALVDAVESVVDEEFISIKYPPNVSSCTISVKGLDAKIHVTQREFTVAHRSSVEPKKLINSFITAQRLLVGEHDLKLLPFHS